MCSSVNECQLIQLNFGGNKQSTSEYLAPPRIFRSPAVSEDNTGVPDSTANSVKRDSVTLSSNGSSIRLSSDANDSQDDCVIRHLADCGSGDIIKMNKTFQRTSFGPRGMDGELLSGPVNGNTSPCPVTVEFEGELSFASSFTNSVTYYNTGTNMGAYISESLKLWSCCMAMNLSQWQFEFYCHGAW